MPRHWEARVHQAVAAYQQLQRLLDEVSEREWKRSEAAGRNDVLRRLLHYAEKVYGLRDSLLAAVGDTRPRPRIPTRVVLQSVLVLFWTRLGSLNALETLAPAPFWKQWLGREMPSADTLGRVYSRLDAAAVRAAIHHVYERLKRNKALPGIGGLAWPCSTAMSLTPATAVAVEDA